MQIHEIKREHALKKKKLVGRGGTRGKTSGRGGKGQTARAGHSVRPAMRDIIKKLPKLRGHGKNRAQSVFYRGPSAVVNVSKLNIFTEGEVVNPTSLIAKKLISASFGKHPTVKILGTGELTVKILVERCDVSATAKTKIEKLGGSITANMMNDAHSEGQIARTKARKEAKSPKAKPAKKK